MSTGDTKEIVKMVHRAYLGGGRESSPFGGSSSMVLDQFVPLGQHP